MKKFYLLILMIPILCLPGCEKEKTQEEKDQKIIEDYLAENDLDAIKHSSGIYYIIEEEGSGGHPELSQEVTVKYKGYLTNNTVFDETTGDQTITYGLYQFIAGWQIGIPLLQRGGKGTFFIPSRYGYGSQALPSIPANSVLIFDVELVDFY